MPQSTSNLMLTRLDALVGVWEMVASIDGRTLAHGRTTSEWLDGSAFLIQHAEGGPAEDAPPEWHANSPFPITTIIGLDDSSERFSILYADSRDVFRVIQMTLSDGVWKQWREAPGFNQRFTGTFSDDGKTITGRWEMCRDGVTWNPDFDVTYTKMG